MNTKEIEHSFDLFLKEIGLLSWVWREGQDGYLPKYLVLASDQVRINTTLLTK